MPWDWSSPENWVRLAALAEPIDRLKKAVHTTEELLEWERFGAARTALGDGDHDRAWSILEPVLGRQTDFRVLLLAGVMCLGSHLAPHRADLAKAEEYFRAAARACSGDEGAALLALLGASWAAYASGALDRALVHVQQALARNAECPEAQWELARLTLQMNHRDEALLLLRRASLIDPDCLLRAALDDAFSIEEPILVEMASSVRAACAQSAQDAWVQWKEKESGLAKFAEDSGETMGALVLQVEQLRNDANAQVALETAWGHRSAGQLIQKASQGVDQLARLFRTMRQSVDEKLVAAKAEWDRVCKVQVGTYKLTDFVATELAQARSVLEDVERKTHTPTFRTLGEAEQQATRVEQTMRGLVDRFRTRAMEKAAHERELLAQEIVQLSQQPLAWDGRISILVALLVGVVPGWMSGESLNMSSLPRIVLGMLIIGSLSAILGPVAVSFYSHANGEQCQKLELRRKALEADLAKLRAFAPA